MGQLSQGSGLSGNTVRVTAALFKTLMSESSFGSVYSHMRCDPALALAPSRESRA